MNKLSYACSGALSAITAYDCPTDLGNRVDLLIVGKDGETDSVTTGDIPTVSDFQTAMALTTDAKLVVIPKVTNGLCQKVSSTELSGMDTLTGGKEEHDVIKEISGTLKHLTQDLLEKTGEYSQHSILRVWIVTNKGYCFGGSKGYKCSSRGAFTPIEIDGTKSHVKFSLQYNSDLVEEDTNQDDDYLDLDNS